MWIYESERKCQYNREIVQGEIGEIWRVTEGNGDWIETNPRQAIIRPIWRSYLWKWTLQKSDWRIRVRTQGKGRSRAIKDLFIIQKIQIKQREGDTRFGNGNVTIRQQVPWPLRKQLCAQKRQWSNEGSTQGHHAIKAQNPKDRGRIRRRHQRAEVRADILQKQESGRSE